MAEIKAAMVKELRDVTGVSMMECKRALVETSGDQDQAVKILRERGVAMAAKKASRKANEGAVASRIMNDAKSGVMLELNCETDFVSRNEKFQGFVSDLMDRAETEKGDLVEVFKDDITAAIQGIGENIQLKRSVRFDLDGSGIIATYIHLGGKVGVLVDIGCENDETTKGEAFKELVRDITLHIAASSPSYLTRDEVPEEVIAPEKAIFATQAEGKPEAIIEKIVTGKIDKFFNQICLLEQGFVKDGDVTIDALLVSKGKELGDTLSIRRFARYLLGDEG